jgi:hypothetical protein
MCLLEILASLTPLSTLYVPSFVNPKHKTKQNTSPDKVELNPRLLANMDKEDD